MVAALYFALQDIESIKKIYQQGSLVMLTTLLLFIMALRDVSQDLLKLQNICSVHVSLNIAILVTKRSL